MSRDPDRQDGRRKRVQITDAGVVFLDDLDQVIGAVRDELLRPLTPGQRVDLVDLLARLQPHADDDRAPRRRDGR